MPFDLWIAFAAASLLLLLLPGPTVLLVVGTALARGRAAALAMVPGVMAGDAVAMTASLAGLGAVLATSATAFAVLKWAGAAYLVWLGVRMWRRSAAGAVPVADDASPRALGLRAFVVTALNPKGIAFFVAFVPQFVDPARPLLPQVAILEATFVTLAGLNGLGDALLVGRARRAVLRPATLRLLNRAGAGALVGAGAITATMQRA